ncbi:MAG: hypothetical protein EXR72_23315 [Myxococcales bacterium]|nr:hypothetical protein [Myxococcales bacterium]
MADSPASSYRTILLLLLALGAPAAAGEADDEIARTHFACGMTYFRAERSDPSVKEFLEAYRLSRRPDFLSNIGLA